MLSLLDRSAAKVGADPQQLFERAAQLASPRAADELRKFAARPAAFRSIEAMGYHEDVAAPDGFRYVRDW